MYIYTQKVKNKTQYVCSLVPYSSKAHHLGREPQEPGERVGQELPCKQEANRGVPPVVLAGPPSPVPEPPQEIHGDLHPSKPRRVRPAMGPIHPGHAPPGARRRPVPDVEERGQIVLVGVAVALAEPLECREVDGVGDHLGRQGPAQLEPLRALAPVPKGYAGGAHAALVPAPARAARLVVGLHEGPRGVDQVGVDRGEVEERDVRLGEKDEARVGGVQ